MKKPISLLIITLTTISLSRGQFMEPNFLNRDTSAYTSSFVAEWAGDTASIETFTITGNHLFGRAIHLYPEPHLRQFDYEFNPNGSIRAMNVQFYDLENTSTPLRASTGLPYSIKMNAQHEVVDFRVIDKTGEKQFVHLAKRMDFFGGWIPIFAQWQWLADLLTEERINKDLKFLNYVIGDYEIELHKISDNAIVFNSGITAPITLYLDADKKIEKIDAIGSPWNYIVHRSTPINVEDYCKLFAKKEIIGDPSPHEQFEVDITDCRISIDYGRPSKRGREIFGNVVPFDIVWRTGAGMPTTFTTNKELNFRDVIIPKGTYNIFTIPGKKTWTLIFNVEEEAWGSAYRSAFDFAKIPMEVSANDQVVEKFRIEIIPEEKGGVLKLMWDKTIASVPFHCAK